MMGQLLLAESIVVHALVMVSEPLLSLVLQIGPCSQLLPVHKSSGLLVLPVTHKSGSSGDWGLLPLYAYASATRSG